jgi:hypothetical protein
MENNARIWGGFTRHKPYIEVLRGTYGGWVESDHRGMSRRVGGVAG